MCHWTCHERVSQDHKITCHAHVSLFHVLHVMTAHVMRMCHYFKCHMSWRHMSCSYVIIFSVTCYMSWRHVLCARVIVFNVTCHAGTCHSHVSSKHMSLQWVIRTCRSNISCTHVTSMHHKLLPQDESWTDVITCIIRTCGTCTSWEYIIYTCHKVHH